MLWAPSPVLPPTPSASHTDQTGLALPFGSETKTQVGETGLGVGGLLNRAAEKSCRRERWRGLGNLCPRSLQKQDRLAVCVCVWRGGGKAPLPEQCVGGQQGIDRHQGMFETREHPVGKGPLYPELVGPSWHLTSLGEAVCQGEDLSAGQSAGPRWGPGDHPRCPPPGARRG